MSSGVVLTSAAGQAPRGEDRQAKKQCALSTLAIAHAARGQHQGGKDEAVGVDDPLQLRCRGAQAPHQSGQGDVHDGDVHTDDEGGETKSHNDAQPAPSRRHIDRRHHDALHNLREIVVL